MLKDKVFIDRLSSTAITGSDAWNRPTPQPITITVLLDTDFSQAYKTDNLKYSLNYAVISRNIMEYMKINQHRNFKSLQNIGEEISKITLDPKKGGGVQGEVAIRSAKSEIRADWIEYRLSRHRDQSLSVLDTINVKQLRLLTIIGVFTFERMKRQLVDIDFSIRLLPDHNVKIHKIMDEVTNYVESSNFKTVEALEQTIGQLVFQNHGDHISSITVTVTKPNAITSTEGVGVQSELTKDRFEGTKPLEIPSLVMADENGFNLKVSEEDSKFDVNAEHTGFIAFGSNEGNQLENVNTAIALLNEFDINVTATSSMYISKPMYYKEQSDFVNGVLKVKFLNKTPDDILKILKDIEYNHINRLKEFDNGPRSIDLDILLIDDVIINSELLTIPHKSMLDRTFVLQPLCELISPEVIHPVSNEPIHNHLKELLNNSPDDLVQDSSDLLQLTPIPRFPISENPLIFDQVNDKSPTLMMGILNITPDSFSDGGKNFGVGMDQIVSNAKSMLENGSKVIDIGGMSTKPGSEAPSEQEELDRVIPVIQAIRNSKDQELSQCVISIDTYRSGVAEQCLKAGADIINDISMGLYDDKMFDVIAKYGCPYVMNHTRGTTKTMNKLVKYEANTNEDIIEMVVDPSQGVLNHISTSPEVNNLINGICREQSHQIINAFERGVRKWQIIIDPGIGFAKNLPQNLAILKNSSFIKKYAVTFNKRSHLDGSIDENYVTFNGLPILLGPSRKKFLGTLNNEPNPEDRVFTTGASIMACIQQCTNIVRVHDTKEIRKVIVIGDAIYKEIY